MCLFVSGFLLILLVLCRVLSFREQIQLTLNGMA